MRSHGLIVLIAIALIGTHGAQAAPEPRIVDCVPVNTSIGTPPPMNPADYVPYAKRGDNLLAFPWALQFSNGLYQPCTEHHDDAALYPSTPYTRWLIHRFILDTVDHDKRMGRIFPGDTGFAVVAPSFLQPFTKDSVVRMGSCVRG